MSNIIHHFNGGLYTKEMHLEAGDTIIKHTHDYDHQSILVSGEVVLSVGGELQVLTAPAVINIKANVEHEARALTPVVWLCQHITTCTDPDEVDNVLIGQGEA